MEESCSKAMDHSLQQRDHKLLGTASSWYSAIVVSDAMVILFDGQIAHAWGIAISSLNHSLTHSLTRSLAPLPIVTT